MERPRIRCVIAQSVVTSTVVVLAFLAIVKAALGLLGITVADSLIAGGTLLFRISLRGLLTVQMEERMVDTKSIGAVPLAVPSMVSPVVLTTTILLVRQHSLAATVVGIFLAGLAFCASDSIIRVLGEHDAKTISKPAASFSLFSAS